MKILLIEDSPIDQKIIINYVLKLGFVDYRLAKNLEDAEMILKTYHPNLIITDVYVNDRKSFELFENNQYSKIPCIFVTSSIEENDFLQSTLIANAVYLLKPFHYLSLLSIITKLIRQNYHTIQNDFDGILVKGSNNIKKIIPFSEIIYLEVIENYCKVNTSKSNYIVRIPLKEIKEKNNINLVQVHRKYIVNINYISNVNISKMIVTTLEKALDIPIGRTFKKDAIALANSLLLV